MVGTENENDMIVMISKILQLVYNVVVVLCHDQVRRQVSPGSCCRGS